LGSQNLSAALTDMDKAESIATKLKYRRFFQDGSVSSFRRFISNITDSVFHNKRKTIEGQV